MPSLGLDAVCEDLALQVASELYFRGYLRDSSACVVVYDVTSRVPASGSSFSRQTALSEACMVKESYPLQESFDSVGSWVELALEDSKIRTSCSEGDWMCGNMAREDLVEICCLFWWGTRLTWRLSGGSA